MKVALVYTSTTSELIELVEREVGKLLPQNTEIMRNVTLNYVILDKDVIVRENRQLVGHETYPVVIEKKSIV